MAMDTTEMAAAPAKNTTTMPSRGAQAQVHCCVLPSCAGAENLHVLFTHWNGEEQDTLLRASSAQLHTLLAPLAPAG